MTNTAIDLTTTAPVRTAHLNADGTAMAREERVRRLMQLNIKHPKWEAAFSAIQLFEEKAASATSGVNYLIIGPSRVGKTNVSQTLYKRMLEKEAAKLNAKAVGDRIEQKDGDIRPVIWVGARDQLTHISLAEELLQILGDPSPKSGTVAQKERRLARHLSLQKVKTIIIDESQHFVETRTKRFQYHAADWLKSNLLNSSYNTFENGDALAKSFCNVIFFGTESVSQLIAGNEQLKGRNLGCYVFKPYGWIDQSDRAHFLNLLMTIDHVIPFSGASGLSEIQRAFRIHQATDGSIGRTMKLIQTAGVLAIRDDSDRIVDEHLRDAFDELEAAFSERHNPWRAVGLSDQSPLKPSKVPSRTTRLKGKGPVTAPTFAKK